MFGSSRFWFLSEAVPQRVDDRMMAASVVETVSDVMSMAESEGARMTRKPVVSTDRVSSEVKVEGRVTVMW